MSGSDAIWRDVFGISFLFIGNCAKHLAGCGREKTLAHQAMMNRSDPNQPGLQSLDSLGEATLETSQEHIRPQKISPVSAIYAFPSPTTKHITEIFPKEEKPILVRPSYIKKQKGVDGVALHGLSDWKGDLAHTPP